MVPTVLMDDYSSPSGGGVRGGRRRGAVMRGLRSGTGQRVVTAVGRLTGGPDSIDVSGFRGRFRFSSLCMTGFAVETRGRFNKCSVASCRCVCVVGRSKVRSTLISLGIGPGVVVLTTETFGMTSGGSGGTSFASSVGMTTGSLISFINEGIPSRPIRRVGLVGR